MNHLRFSFVFRNMSLLIFLIECFEKKSIAMGVNLEPENKVGTDLKYYEEISNVMNTFVRSIQRNKMEVGKLNKTNLRYYESQKNTTNNSLNNTSLNVSDSKSNKNKTKKSKKKTSDNKMRNSRYSKLNKSDSCAFMTKQESPLRRDLTSRDKSQSKNVYQRLYEDSETRVSPYKSQTNDITKEVLKNNYLTTDNSRSDHYIYKRLNKEFHALLDEVNVLTKSDFQPYDDFISAVKKKINHDRFYSHHKLDSMNLDLSKF